MEIRIYKYGNKFDTYDISIEEAIKIADDLNDVEIIDFPIGGGTGEVIEKAYLGTMSDMQDFVSSIREDMLGWTEVGGDYTLAWHEGKFFDITNSLSESISQMDMDEEDFEEQKVTVWYDSYDKDLYIFGIYNAENFPL